MANTQLSQRIVGSEKKKRQKEKLAEQAETKQVEKKKVESKPKPAEKTEAEIRKKNDEVNFPMWIFKILN